MKATRKLIYYMLTLTLLIACACCIAACGCGSGGSEKSNGEYTFEGLTDIKISENDRNYDFQKGVKCKNAEGDYYEFSIDLGGVKFGTEGEYSAIYSCNGTTAERKVYVYGKPRVSVISSDIDYVAMMNGDISGKVSATDTFGKSLEVVLKNEPNYTATGALATGMQNLIVIATDSFGNVKEQNVRLNVLPSTDDFQIQIPVIDMAKAYFKINVGVRQLKSIYYGTEKADQTMYALSDGYVGITPALIRALGTGANKEVYFNFDTCSVKSVFTITDNEPVNYLINGEINGETYYFDENIELPRVSLSTSSAQDAEFKRYIETDGQKIPYEEFIYDPTTIYTGKTDYSYIVEIYKNGVKERELKEDFTVKNECYYLQDFATQQHLDKWQKQNANATLTQDSRSDSDKVLSLKYYKSDADGDWTTAKDNGLILKAELIAGAKSAGYTRLQFTFRTGSEKSSVFQVHREKDGKYVGDYLLYRGSDASTQWINGSINLSDIGEGQGLIFINLGTTMYLSNLTFKGKDYGITDFSDNFADVRYAYLWEANNAYATTVSSKEVIKGILPTIVVEKDETKTKVNGAYTYWGNYSLYLNEKLIESAIKAGKTKIKLWYLTECYSKDIDKSGALYCYKYTKGTIGASVYIDNYADRTWCEATIDISGFKSGDSLVFYCFGKTMYISNLSFMSGSEGDNTMTYNENGIIIPYILHLANYVKDGFSDVVPYIVYSEVDAKPYLVFASSESDPYMGDYFDD